MAAFVLVVMHLPVSYIAENFLTSCQVLKQDYAAWIVSLLAVKSPETDMFTVSAASQVNVACILAVARCLCRSFLVAGVWLGFVQVV
jgi:hypothetical protein